MAKKNFVKASKPDVAELRKAIKNDDLDLVKDLIARGAEVNIKDVDGWTPLMDACFYGSKDIASLLIAKGADVNAIDRAENTALILSAYSGAADIAELLVKRGAKMDIADNCNNTALILASFHGHTDVVRVLVENGARLDCKDNEGKTAADHIKERGGRGVAAAFAKAKKKREEQILARIKTPATRRPLKIKPPIKFKGAGNG